MSDEDRLRERLHDRADRVPDLSDIDDVAARLGRHRPVRERRLLALVAVALVAGVGIGVVIGHNGDGNERTLAVGSAGAPETTAPPTVGSTMVGRPFEKYCSGLGESTPSAPDCLTTNTLVAPTLPDPGAEQPADPDAARDAVGQAWIDASDGASSNEVRSAAIEGGAGLVTVFDELHRGPYGDQVRTAKTVIDEVVFLSPTRATVRFHADLADGSISGPYTGDALLDGDTWLAARASYCQIVSLAGVRCPG